MRVAAVDVREVRDREAPVHARKSRAEVRTTRRPTRCYLGLRWRWKRPISRHIEEKELRASSTRRSSSTPRSSTTTACPGCTSPTRSCSSATRTGASIEAFTPDFYLPEQDLYLEVTVMKQSLVTRKNRKLRKLRELYPDVRSSSSTSATSRGSPRATACARPRDGSRARRADRRGLPRRGGDRRARARARRRDRARLRRPRAAARRRRSRRASRSSPTSRRRSRSRTRSTSSSSPATARREIGGHERIRFLKDLDLEIGGPRRAHRRRGRRHRA